MIFPLFRRDDRQGLQLSRRGIPRELPPYLMRDIGLEPCPERPRLPFHSLW
ncbi:hypothetical protein SAMN05216236_11263 [Sedimentitalea nanhaiensis]|uniref:Uncharacterized protein n=1 Tax=Sedimentitalea nanhaiensis TaxID=999627 RepID=A0A1I7BV87_9RHOB|nr:hypothetical protein SAMN05216236_11263 [Sedimentitalea nanhaiensis]